MSSLSACKSVRSKQILKHNSSNEGQTHKMKLKFIRSDTGEISAQMHHAFELYSSAQNEDETEWISEEETTELLNFSLDRIVFVCQEFVGTTFQRLNVKRARVVGPRCLIACHERGERLPKTTKPTLTATMSGLYVSCTCIEREARSELHEKIELMGGEVRKELTAQVTHLVCGEVGSKKYHVACSLNKQVMLPEWIEECWKEGSSRSVHASDEEFDKFRCLMFHGFSMSVSQVSAVERKELEKLIKQNGGKYSGEMRINETTHLILDVPEGRKFGVAKQRNISCMKLAWIYDSVERGYCQDENLYALDCSDVKSGQGSSTPIKGQKDALLPDISTLSAINATIDETVCSNASRLNDFSVNQDTTLECWLKDLDVSTVSKAGPFLDGCKILLSGFSPSTMEKLIKVLNSGAATRFRQLTDSVSHIVVGSKIEAEHKRILEEDHLIPYIVNIGWIVESHRLKRPADEADYLETDLLGAKLQIDTIFPELSMANEKTSSSVNKLSKNVENRSELEFNDVMNQYMDGGDSQLEEEEFESKVFTKKSFCAFGFDHFSLNNVREMVEENGGKFYDVLSKPIFDYAIVPIPACEIAVKAKHIVSNYWLQRCVFNKSLFDVEMDPLFGPIDIDVKLKPLKGCVLSFSKYIGLEKDCVVQVAKLLGAMCQESFSRKMDKSRGLLENTHLIAPDPEGKKYEAAVKWGLPVVNCLWIVNCAIRNERLNESEYMISDHSKTVSKGDTMLITKQQTIERTASTSSSASRSPEITSRRQLSSTSLTSSNVPLNKQSTSSSDAGADTNSDCKTPIKDSVFKTPTCSHLADTAERVTKMQDVLHSKHNIPFLRNNRVKELIGKEGDDSLNSSCDSFSAFNTPSKFTNPDVTFQPRLGIREAMGNLESPCPVKTKEVSPTSRLPLEDLYNLRINQALHNEVEQTGFVSRSTLEDLRHENDIILRRPLSGIVVTVSKKLSNIQSELNVTAEKLGATCKWLYDKSCTHFVHMGKPKERCKDLHVAMNDNKFIVSPEWLRACEKSNTRIDEKVYPYTYNPNMALDIVIQKSTTPLRSSQRKVVAAKNGNDLNPAPVKTDRKMMIESANLKMEEIMAATKVARDKRVNRVAIQSNSSSGGSPSMSSFVDGSGNRSLKSSKKSVAPIENESEPWESIPITWDDPASRLERTKLLAQLRTDSQPSYDEDEDEDDNTSHLNDHGDSVSSHRDVSSSLQCAQNYNFDSSDSFQEDSSESYVFMFTKLDDEERLEAIKIVENYGGRVIDSQNFDMQCTHLVAKSPNRSEKFLASVAAGIWVLHVSYLEACQAKQQFVKEEKYEFAEEGIRLNLSIDGARLATSARYWRFNGQNSKKTRKCGAFFDWKVIIYSSGSRTGSFVRLLEAGGATVLSTTPPFTNVKGATHAFVDMAYISKPNIDLSALISANVLCLKPEYICTYLSDKSSVSVETFYIPEVLPLLKSSLKCDDSLVKRKSDEKDKTNKRSRQK